VLRAYPRNDQKTAIRFIDYVLAKLPFAVEQVQTDNGQEFGQTFHWHLLDQGIGHVRILSSSGMSLRTVVRTKAIRRLGRAEGCPQHVFTRSCELPLAGAFCRCRRGRNPCWQQRMPDPGDLQETSMRMTHRFAAAAGSLALALAGVCYTASTADADVPACEEYLAQKGHEDSALTQGCKSGAQGDFGGCLRIMTENGLELTTASEACLLAQAEPAA
jgi:hypothetical protein